MSLYNSRFVLPKIGEYAYFDTILEKHIPHFIVKTESGEMCGCHYSLDYKKKCDKNSICHGIIVYIPLNQDNINKIKKK